MTLKISGQGVVTDSAAVPREHPGTGEPMTAVEHPADGTMSPPLSNEHVEGGPSPLAAMQEPPAADADVAVAEAELADAAEKLEEAERAEAPAPAPAVPPRTPPRRTPPPGAAGG